MHASVNICRHLDIVEMFYDEIKVQEKLVITIADYMKLYYSWCESTSLYAYLLVIQNLLEVENT